MRLEAARKPNGTHRNCSTHRSHPEMVAENLPLVYDSWRAAIRRPVVLKPARVIRSRTTCSGVRA